MWHLIFGRDFSCNARMISDCHLEGLLFAEITSVPKKRNCTCLFSPMPRGNSVHTLIKEPCSTVRIEDSIVLQVLIIFTFRLFQHFQPVSWWRKLMNWNLNIHQAYRLTRMRQMACHPDLVLRSKTNSTTFVPIESEGTVCRLCNEFAEDAIQSKCHHIFDRECIRQYLLSSFEDQVRTSLFHQNYLTSLFRSPNVRFVMLPSPST
jgi:hypothetical protein